MSPETGVGGCFTCRGSCSLIVCCRFAVADFVVSLIFLYLFLFSEFFVFILFFNIIYFLDLLYFLSLFHFFVFILCLYFAFCICFSLLYLFLFFGIYFSFLVSVSHHCVFIFPFCNNFPLNIQKCEITKIKNKSKGSLSSGFR